MQIPAIQTMSIGGLISALTLFGGMGRALAHWGHLGELAGHGHVIGAALAGVAVGLTALLAARGWDAADNDENIADTDGEDNDRSEGELIDA